MSVLGDYRFAVLTSVPASGCFSPRLTARLPYAFRPTTGNNLRIPPMGLREYPLPKEHGSARFYNCLRLLCLPKEIAYGHPDDINERIEIGH